MIEGAAPPAVRPDPLLPESGWREAGGSSRAGQRMASERCNYLSALASAPRQTLSYPIADAGSRRQAYPSRWFLELASALEGKPVHTGDLPALRERPWLTVTDSGEQALSEVPKLALADRHDYVLSHLLRWKNAGQRAAQHPLVQSGAPARALRAGTARSARRLTEFDGNLSGWAKDNEFRLGPAQSPVSATRLESWAKCPFSYFLGHVLGIAPLETPEEIIAISSLERGGLVHRILEEFISAEVESGRLPAPGEPWEEPARERLFAIAERAFAAAEQRGATGKRLLWLLAKQGIRDDLESFLENDSALRQRQGTGRIDVELLFGFGDDETRVMDSDTQVHFRGKIDRLDISADGQSVLVIDYKTGSAGPYKALERDVIDAGRLLQLGVYSLAAQQLAPDASEVRAAYWFSTASGRFQFAPPEFFDIANDATRARFREGVSKIVSGIQQGVFPANPGPPDQGGYANCRFCDFDSLCPTRREEIWQRKASDAPVAGYLSLSEQDAEAEE